MPGSVDAYGFACEQCAHNRRAGLRQPPPVADPLVDHVVQTCGRRLIPVLPCSKAYEAHDVSDPSDFDVLFLQKIVVNKRRTGLVCHASNLPEKLNPEPFCERSVVEVFFVPIETLCHKVWCDATRKEQQKGPDHELHIVEVGVHQKRYAKKYGEPYIALRLKLTRAW